MTLTTRSYERAGPPALTWVSSPLVHAGVPEPHATMLPFISACPAQFWEFGCAGLGPPEAVDTTASWRLRAPLCRLERPSFG